MFSVIRVYQFFVLTSALLTYGGIRVKLQPFLSLEGKTDLVGNVVQFNCKHSCNKPAIV